MQNLTQLKVLAAVARHGSVIGRSLSLISL